MKNILERDNKLIKKIENLHIHFMNKIWFLKASESYWKVHLKYIITTQNKIYIFKSDSILKVLTELVGILYTSKKPRLENRDAWKVTLLHTSSYRNESRLVYSLSLMAVVMYIKRNLIIFSHCFNCKSIMSTYKDVRE